MALILALGIVCMVGYVLEEVHKLEGLGGWVFAALIVFVTLACILFT